MLLFIPITPEKFCKKGDGLSGRGDGVMPNLSVSGDGGKVWSIELGEGAKIWRGFIFELNIFISEVGTGDVEIPPLPGANIMIGDWEGEAVTGGLLPSIKLPVILFPWEFEEFNPCMLLWWPWCWLLLLPFPKLLRLFTLFDRTGDWLGELSGNTGDDELLPELELDELLIDIDIGLGEDRGEFCLLPPK